MTTRTATFFDLVRPSLDEVEERMRARIGEHHAALDSAIDHLLSSGGKRVRPTVVLLTAALFGGDRTRAVTLAAAIEMLHTATLVHDDLIDGALLRRGTPTLNAQWTPGATVLTGDYIFARAAHLAAQTGSLVVMEMFAETLMTIVGGEISQLFRSRSGDLRRDYFDRIYAKTASLFEVSTAAAAVLSGAPAAQVASAKTVGYNLGVAFQIVDDVLDFVGNQEEVGKPVASDLRQGLLTLPALLAIDSRPVDDDFIDAILQRRLDPSVLEDLIWQVRTSDAIARSLDEARSYVRLAQDSLAALPDCRERDALSELAAYIVQRTL
jgi:geranylgeranyl pyrophosphate synthase